LDANESFLIRKLLCVWCFDQELTSVLETQIPALMDMLPKTTEALLDDQGNVIAYNVPLPVRRYSRRSSAPIPGQSWNTEEDSSSSPGYAPTPPQSAPPRRGSAQASYNYTSPPQTQAPYKPSPPPEARQGIAGSAAATPEKPPRYERGHECVIVLCDR